MALDLTYRPRCFSDVVGNAGVVKLLQTHSRAGTLVGRSMMFGGPKGSGKTSLARVVARAIFCDGLKDGEPCGECVSCKSVDDGSGDSFDEFDAATQGTVERMRGIIEDLEYGTVSGKPRLIILDEAHRLSKQSQDALLKAMEDRRIVVVLCTTEPHSIKTAIRSRVEEYPISYPTQQDALARVSSVCEKEGIQADPEALALIVKLNSRCLRTCLTSLESVKAIGAVNVDNVQSVLRFASMENVVAALSLLSSNAASAITVFDTLFDQEGPTWVRDQVVSAISSAMRISLGATATHPVAPSFWEPRGSQWLQLAQGLSLLERPNQADIEAVLYAGLGAVVAMPAPVAPVVPPPAAPVTPPVTSAAPVTQTAPQVEKPAPPPPVAVVIPIKKSPEVTAPNPAVVKSVEIDGVRYSSNEALTSLDHKIGQESRSEPEKVADLQVEFDSESVPMTEKEFASGFLERVRS